MADTEFEEFRQAFEKLPQNLKAPAPYYSLVPLNLEEEYPSSKSDSSDQDEDDKLSDISLSQPQPPPTHVLPTSSSTSSSSATATTLSICNISNTINNNHINNNHNNSDVGGSGVGGVICNNSSTNGVGSDNVNDTTNHLEKPNINSFPHLGCFERKRRKLPEIPKLRKPLIFPFANGPNINNHSSSHNNNNGMTSLADELGSCGAGGGIGNGGGIGIGTGAHNPRPMNFNSSFSQRSLLTLKCSYLLDEDSSPDSERLHSLGDVDSGHSTSHSPNDFKSMSPQMASSPSSPFPPPFGGVPMSQLEMLEATHRGLHKFIPRHHDEIEIEIGDPIYVQKEADDLWCEGVNLRTGRQGIFPSAYAVDLDYNDFDPSSSQVKKERYLLGYLGSVETVAHKGTGVVCQAVRKICGEYGDSPKAQPCILEVSDQGLRMVDRSKPQKREKGACIDYFYSLKNVSFCAFHPRDHRYIGFITKHPTVQRFACHVFKGHESTRPVAEAVGRAFHRFYQKFIETAYPIEDIYIE